MKPFMSWLQKSMQLLGRLREVLDISDEESIRISTEVAAELQQYHKKAQKKR